MMPVWAREIAAYWSGLLPTRPAAAEAAAGRPILAAVVSPTSPSGPLAALTPREREVLDLVARGLHMPDLNGVEATAPCSSRAEMSTSPETAVLVLTMLDAEGADEYEVVECGGRSP